MAKFDNNILENKVFLYACFIITSISLIFFSKVGDPNTTAIFLISGFLISLLTKKMAIVLLLALVISFIYRYGVSRMVNYREGLSNSLNNSIDSIVNDPKTQQFFDSNTRSQNKRIISIITNIKGILSNLKSLINDIQDIQNDKDFINKGQKFFADNNAYYAPKISTFNKELSEELKGKDIYGMVLSGMDVANKAITT